MKSTRTRTPRRQDCNATATSQEFDEMPDPRDVVEHLTIPGFLRRAPHRFHFDEITRFGDKVGRIAESLQVSYLTTIDRQLGMLRLFPVPLMVRVYKMMATQFHWEPYPEEKAIEDGQTAALRSHERAKKHLEEATVGDNMPPAVAEAMQIAISWLENETQRLRGEEPPPTLRAI